MARSADIEERISRALKKDKELPERDVELEKQLTVAVSQSISGVLAIDEVIRQYNVGLHRSQSNMKDKLSVRFYAKRSRKMMCRRPWMNRWFQGQQAILPRECPRQYGFVDQRLKTKIHGAPPLENDPVTARLLGQLEALFELRKEAMNELKQVLLANRRLMKRINARLAFHERKLPEVMQRLVHDWMDPEASAAAIELKRAARKEHRRYKRR